MSQFADLSALQSLVGTWAPAEDGDSNVHFTVTVHGGRVVVTAVDPFDGEPLKVSSVIQDGSKLRFYTLTPSTGASVEHELEALPGEQARYRYTVAQTWQRLTDAPAPPSLN